MLITLFRAAILYTMLIVCFRLMGKRQIGELQPIDLVITVLISEIAAIPIQQNNLPILNSIVAVLVLVSLELILSAISMKAAPFRTMMQGHSLVVIRDGVIDQRAMRRLRITVSDLISALRQKDVFDLSTVSYAIFETNGKLSVLLRPDSLPATAADAGQTSPADNGVPFVVACDGKFVKTGMREAGMTKEKILKPLNAKKISLEQVFIMTVDKSGQISVIRKDEQK